MKIYLPQHIEVEQRTAGFGSRLLAYLFDFALRWLSLFLILLFTFLIYQQTTSALEAYRNIQNFITKQGMSALRVWSIVFIFSFEWAYPVFFEVCNKGVTPAKALFGLRVLDERGLPLNLRSSILRSLFLTVDYMPFVALFSMQFTKKRQRIGDLVAKTVVVYEREGESEIKAQVPETIEDLRIQKGDMSQCSGELVEIIDSYYQRQKFIEPLHNKKLKERIEASCLSRN